MKGGTHRGKVVQWARHMDGVKDERKVGLRKGRMNGGKNDEKTNEGREKWNTG